MLLRYATAIAFVLAAASPALADECGPAPLAPASIDGNTATTVQMKAAHDDVVNFIKASDDYQACLVTDLAAQKEKAAKEKDPKPLDPSIEAGVNAKLQSNQDLKEKVGGEFNTAVAAYKAKHPKG